MESSEGGGAAEANARAGVGDLLDAAPAYAELHCLTNFSFLRGASHPDELVEQAAALGYAGLAITDRNSLAGVVRAHLAAREAGLHLIVGAEIVPVDAPPVVLLAPTRTAYARLARLITRGRLRVRKGACALRFADLAELCTGSGLIAILIETAWEPQECAAPPQSRRPPDDLEAYDVSGATPASRERRRLAEPDPAPEPRGARQPEAEPPPDADRPALQLARSADFAGTPACPPPLDALAVAAYRRVFGGDLYLAVELAYEEPDDVRLSRLETRARELRVALIAANAVHYHVPERRYLQDVLTCVRARCTVASAGRRLFANAERHLRPRDELARRYGARGAALLARTVEIARRCTFSLDELRYEYPHELVPPGRTAHDHLAELTWTGARERYPDGLPERVRQLLEKELELIAELRYEHYFLTVWDLVRYARGRGILCQGRGSAANSAVCYCLGVTAVDPARIDLLFERFISRERNEPPDIDVDFEHARREEVFQYIYEKYGRERAAITAEVITYRPRSAVRDVGKALGLSLDRVDTLAKALDWWDAEAVPEQALRAAGFAPEDRTIQMIIRLVRQLLGFPRHLSQHVGGFVITETPLCEIVPLENGAMPDRTFIEWDKDDIDALGILKVDCLALGMLTAISKCFASLQRHHGAGGSSGRDAGVGGKPGLESAVQQAPTATVSAPIVPRGLADVPAEDPAVYDLICAADTVGVFQIESRAQMSMLPRLRPRCFYDLVIEVAIVRPGPIQGGMIHPYLRRRSGLEPVTYPSEAVRDVLGKTLGVPLFQEQVMRLAVVAAGFSPGEADKLRRLMAAWRRSGALEQLQVRLIQGMLANGYSPQFAEQIYQQIRGFGEYGFPESHSASFALLVYVSAWLKRYHPAAFCGALLNAQPMGFYAPAQLIRDAQRHGVQVRPVDVNRSDYDCTLEDTGGASGKAAECAGPALRLGLRLIRGLSAEKVRGVLAARAAGPITALEVLDRRSDVSRDTLLRLAAADAFRSLGLDRRQALWQILALDDADLPLLVDLPPAAPPPTLPRMPLDETVAQDYEALGLSLNAHPLELVRADLARLRLARNLTVSPTKALLHTRQGQRIAVAGLVTHRQRPGTAKGIVFMTLEDESGTANLIVRQRVWARDRAIAGGKIAVIAEGTVERQGAVIHLQTQRFHDLSARLGPLRTHSRDFH